MDPQKTYYTYAIGIINAIHRGLYAYPPADPLEPVPDLADGMPEISEDGKTVTVKIKKGVMFSKPVSREVTSKDVQVRHRARVHRRGRQRLRPRLPRRHRRRAEGAGPVQGARGHHDARRPDDRLQAHQGHRRGARRRAGDADLGPRAEGVRREVRRQDPVDLRRGLRGLHRPVHGRVRRPRARPSATCPGKRIHLVRNPDYAAGRRLPSRLSWTRSTSRPATRTRPWRRAASCPART